MKPTYEELLAFVQQMARFSTPQQEYDEDPDLQERYEDASDYASDLSSDRLYDEYTLFGDMIEAAQALVSE